VKEDLPMVSRLTFTFFFSLLLLLILFFPKTITATNYETITDVPTFVKYFSKAWQAGDSEKIGELIRNSEAIVFDVVWHYLQLGVVAKAKDEKLADNYLNLAGNIAVLYRHEFNKEGLLNVAKQYMRYTREMCSKLVEAMSLAGEGEALYMKGQREQAITKCKEALEIVTLLNDSIGEAHISLNIGQVYSVLEQYAKALTFLQKSLDIYQKIGAIKDEVEALISLGDVLSKLGRVTEAASCYAQAFLLIQKMGVTEKKVRSMIGLGNLLEMRQMHSEALKYLEEAYEYSHKAGYPECESIALNNIGTIYLYLDQAEKALDYFKRAIKIARGVKYASGEALALYGLGRVYLSFKQYDDSIDALQKSIRISEQLDQIELLSKGYQVIADARRKSGKLEEAIDSYEKGVVLIEKLHNQMGQSDDPEHYYSNVIKDVTYENFIELLMELHGRHPDKGYDKKAFVVSEKAKSRTFQALMKKAEARATLSSDETFNRMINKRLELISEIKKYRTLVPIEIKKVTETRNEEPIKSLQKKMWEAERKLDELEKEMYAKYPRYADVIMPITAEELQAILKPDETVVSYIVTVGKTFAFIIGKKSFKAIPLPVAGKDLSELVQKFRDCLDNPENYRYLENFKPENAYELYQKVFQNVTKELKGVKKLFISGHHVLYTLPFEALVDGYDQKVFEEARKTAQRAGSAFLGEYSTLHYLIDNTYTITYLPSASVLRSLRNKEHEKPGYGKWRKSLIAFADPIFSIEEATGTGKSAGKSKGIKQKEMNEETKLIMQILSRSPGGVTLRRLAESSEEVMAIAKEVKGREEDIYTREKATEERVFNLDLKASRYILFSTHGLLGGQFRGVAEPALVLTLIDNPPGRDGFLTMSKVLRLDLNAELVILSACNTAGKGDQEWFGEGFAGLTRSFMYAGTKSIFVTHWQVEPSAAKDLMVWTFENIKNKSKTEALRDAKLKMKGTTRREPGEVPISWSHPYFWAPFVIVGEN
jgi:CHAT domain-containing protein/tetratricopeptide (TPR) repeat protein